MDPEHTRLIWFLTQIADGDMPNDWHAGNLAWWLRGLARQALRQTAWGTVIAEPKLDEPARQAEHRRAAHPEGG